MYRKFLLPALIAALSSSAYAQSTLTAANTNPTVGDAYAIRICDGSTAVAGTGGPSAVWDFSGLVGTTNDTNRVISCASAVSPACSTYPTSNIVMSGTSVTSNANNYLNASSTSLAQVGAYIASDTNLVMSDPADQLHYPFTYLSSFSDNFSGILTVSGLAAHHNGTVNVNCDGYGTLILPSRTDTGVLRVHSTQTFTDSTNILGTPLLTSYSISSYDWYKPGYHAPLLTIQTMTELGSPSPTTYKFVAYAAANLSAVADLPGIATSLTVYPNPATNELKVSCDATEVPTITLYDALGKAVASATGVKNGSTYMTSIPVAQLPRGMYMLQISSGAERVTRKITLQ